MINGAGEGKPAAEPHVPVMVDETIELLNPKSGETFVDCTFGRGGHAGAIASRLGPTGRLIVLDVDPDAIESAAKWIETSRPACETTCIHGNFGELPLLLKRLGVSSIDGLMADLGASSPQLDVAERGFGFRREGPLDMRMDPTRGEPASSLIERLSERELARLLYEYADERDSRRIAAAIVRRRREAPIRTTTELAEIVRGACRIQRAGRGHGIDPATRTFQAIRIAVNDELGALTRLLENLDRLVRPGGRAAFLSFHSLEDRLVKRTFAKTEKWKPINKKPAMAGDEEIQRNPRARSAKLRAAIRL